MASYDLRVAAVIASGRVHESDFTVEPQQMFIVVSRETIEVPAGYVGYALPKTVLAQQGILALGTGIIDPGYNGPLSTSAINFDQSPYTIKKGEQFLRIVIHELAESSNEERKEDRTPTSRKKYVESRRKETEKYPDTFLDVPSRMREIEGSIENTLENKIQKRDKRLRNALYWGFGILVGVIAVFTLCLELADRYLDPVIEPATGAQVQEVADLENRLRALERDNKELRREIFQEDSVGVSP